MKAIDLFRRLDRDFILPHLIDDWTEILDPTRYTDNFKKTWMGLALDNTDKIERIYTAVFASKRTIEFLIANDVRNAMLLTHHPMDWDITADPVFQEITPAYLDELQARKISLYNLHTPLDRVSDFSTSVTLAHALGANVLDSFGEFAVIAQTPAKTISELKANFEKAIGHAAKLYPYGASDNIDGGLVAFGAGGGNQPDLFPIMAARGVNTYIVGIAAVNDRPKSIAAHEAARQHQVNLISGTHYSTEKFAMIKMGEYFARLGLPCQFIEEAPCMEDM